MFSKKFQHKKQFWVVYINIDFKNSTMVGGTKGTKYKGTKVTQPKNYVSTNKNYLNLELRGLILEYVIIK